MSLDQLKAQFGAEIKPDDPFEKLAQQKPRRNERLDKAGDDVFYVWQRWPQYEAVFKDVQPINTKACNANYAVWFRRTLSGRHLLILGRGCVITS